MFLSNLIEYSHKPRHWNLFAQVDEYYFEWIYFTVYRWNLTKVIYSPFQSKRIKNHDCGKKF